MQDWKLNVFVTAIRARVERENRSAEDIVSEYKKLSEEEKNEILAKVGG